MTRNLTVLLVILMVGFTAFLIADTPDVSGKWDMIITLPNGKEVSKIISIEQDGEKIIVHKINKNGEISDPMEGTIEGNNITWTEIGIANGEEIEFIHVGTVEGDTISGDIETDYTSFEFTAKKIKT